MRRSRAEIMRGFALIARCAGLVGHIHEEQHEPAMRAMWKRPTALFLTIRRENKMEP